MRLETANRLRQYSDCRPKAARRIRCIMSRVSLLYTA